MSQSCKAGKTLRAQLLHSGVAQKHCVMVSGNVGHMVADAELAITSKGLC